jgi:hypothetical protein
MKLAMTIVLARVTELVLLALGPAFWTGSLVGLIPVHMLNGLRFVLLLEVQAGLAAFAGVGWRLVALAVAWGSSCRCSG